MEKTKIPNPNVVYPIAGYDREIEEINDLIPILTCSGLESVKHNLKLRLGLK